MDRLSLSFPVDAVEGEEMAWERISTANPGQDFAQETRSAREGPFFVSVQTLPPEAPYAAMGKVEWNPSRVVDPEGWSVVPLGEALLSLGRAKASAETRMRPVWSVADWKVRRLDVTRDFELEAGPGETIRALASIHRPWSRRNLVHADPQRNGAQTLMVGSKAGVTRLYDKHAETHGAAPEGTVRWETEARSDWCQRYGEIRRVSDMTSESVEALAVNRFEWSAMGAEVSSSVSQLVHRVQSCEELSGSEKTAFVGFLAYQSAGVVPTLAKGTLAKYRRLQRQLGIVSADLAETVQIMRRLDWESGREVLRVA